MTTLLEAIQQHKRMVDRRAIIETLRNYLQQFLPAEMENAASVIWLEDGGRVTEESLQSFAQEMLDEVAFLDNSIEQFLQNSVSDRSIQ